MKAIKTKQQSGFTLIELLVVIVILGILAATAIPKFIDLSSEAKVAALAGVQGAASAASAINYGGCSAVNNVVTANKCVAYTNCSDTASLLQGGVPSGYSITPAAVAAPPGTVVVCTITQISGGATATFNGFRAGP